MLTLKPESHPLGRWLLGSLYDMTAGVSAWLLVLYLVLVRLWPHSGWPGFGLAVGSFGVVHYLVWRRVVAGGWAALGKSRPLGPRALQTAAGLWLLALHLFQWGSGALALGYVLLAAYHRAPYGIS
ncbi:hypothetical protein HHL22_05735 [Hymenobacter sp. RP-2-7]|uniref:Uncharacterized protein n=1 Tax=Hymenobacter polaris TaxID=2682546 RepID=A0A7Y0AC98_9BACT|nr:hypothetical protein [Hymenobacter polaris]NML64702.1 hypothetical protein [Hymenobacter polaris]